MSYTGVAAALADTGDLADTAAALAGRCRATGLDPMAYRGLAGAAAVLGHRRIPPAQVPWASDRELVQGVAELRDAVIGRDRRLTRLEEHARITLHHARKQAAALPWEKMPEPIRYAIVDSLRAINIVEAVSGNISYASARLAAVPAELGDRYAAAYALIAAGHVLPRNGRWLTGTEG